MSALVWHDLECGGYREDLGLWQELADRHGDPVLDVGAGSGRVTLELARRGHRVVALDRDAELLAALEHRAVGLPVRVVRADARDFADLGEPFALVLAPMQTVQLLDGAAGRRAFLRCAHAQLAPEGVVAIAISEHLEPFEVPAGGPGPLPDVVERDGVLYASHPTAVRPDGDGYVLERRREVVDARGQRLEELDRIRLDAISAPTLEAEAAQEGYRVGERLRIAPTREYVGSEVVLLGG
jgi:SAM-dependent methyltransferase